MSRRKGGNSSSGTMYPESSMNATSQISKMAVELSRKNASVPMSAMVKKLISHAPMIDSSSAAMSTGFEGSAPGSLTQRTITVIGSESAARSGTAERFSAL